ncbi:MAG: hypothetical protein BA874_07355 [Desulfuromonadales bacterium C00003068]|nr:MAG: hypothetical protein BA874_07355 [Desulfuromonadales bacterium C00003068]
MLRFKIELQKQLSDIIGLPSRSNNQEVISSLSGLANRSEKLAGRGQISEHLRANSWSICRKCEGICTGQAISQ